MLNNHTLGFTSRSRRIDDVGRVCIVALDPRTYLELTSDSRSVSVEADNLSVKLWQFSYRA